MDPYVSRNSASDYLFNIKDRQRKQSTSLTYRRNDSLTDTKSDRNSPYRTNNNDKRPLSVSSGLDIGENTSQYTQEAAKLAQTEASNFRLKLLVTIISVISAIVIAGLIVFFVLYFVIFAKIPTYKEECSQSKQCASNTNLVCNGTCVCDSTTYWDGFVCAPLLTFGSTCYGGTFQCESGLTCINNLCQCTNTTYYNGKCLSKLSYNSVCSSCSYSNCPNCISCNQCQDYANLHCNLTTNRCICPYDTHYYDSATQLCVSKLNLNIYCTIDSECKDVTESLYCQVSLPLGSSCPSQPPINFCNCPTNTYFNGTYCKGLESYYSLCTQNCMCDTVKGLYCNVADGRCLCQENFYWSSSSLRCLQQQEFNISCTSSSQCDTSKGLTCSSNTCACKLYPGNWYWSSVGRYCVECPTGWTIITSIGVQKCVSVFYELKSWYNAKLTCEEQYGTLAVLNDTTLFSKLNSIISVTTTSYFVGATDSKIDGRYLWQYDGEVVDYTVVPRCAGEYNGGVNENCLALNPGSSCYGDISCSGTRYFICQKVL